MNLVQHAVAEAIGKHFKRQWQQMDRQGPVQRIQEDQQDLIQDLCTIYTQQNSAFDAVEFDAAIQRAAI